MAITEKLKKYSLLIAVLLITLAIALVLRGPHVSNTLKKVILPELELATGKRVIAQKIYINIFPLFIEAKDLKVFDDEGTKILLAKRVKAYLDISGLFSRSLTIRRLVIRDPVIEASQEQAETIEMNIRNYLANTRKDSLKVKVVALELQRGKADLSSGRLKTALAIDGLGGEVILNESQRVRIEAKSVSVHREGLPAFTGAISGQATVKGDTLTIKKLALTTHGSQVTAEGTAGQGEASLKTAGTVLVSSVKEIFGLQKSGEGTIKVNGAVHYAKDNTTLDLSLAGNFHLETLMELLEVHEKLEGLVEFKGEVKGPLRDIVARGNAVMTRGNLYQVEIDRVACKILYEKGTMSFFDGDGKLYNGRAKASASIALPVVNHFTLDIDFADADSKPLFTLIGWDPGVPAGKVKGTLHHAGENFSPKGIFDYASVEAGNDILGRVRTMTGSYDLEGDLLALRDLTVRTGKSEALAGGMVDIKHQTLDLPVVMTTADLHEITAPYFEPLKGEGEFRGRVTGTFDDPMISGRAAVTKSSIEGYQAESITADLVYRKHLLQVKDLAAGDRTGHARVSGTLAFKDAKELFDIARPTWGLRAQLKNIESEKFVKIFYPAYSGSGRFSATARLEGFGKLPEITAAVSLESATVFEVPIHASSFDFRYAASKIDFTGVTVRQGETVVRGDMTINPDETFTYKASAERIRLSDIIQRPLQGEVIATLTSEGHGDFDNPTITLDARMIDGTLKGKQIGRGVITASLKDKKFIATAKLINDRISISARGRTDGIMPWEASADFQTGRYDFLITSLLKDIPEDLILNLNGSVSLHGTRNHIEGSALIRHVVLSMYGYSFTNEEEISLDLKDRELSLGRIALRSGSTVFRANGSIAFGRSYNIAVEGSSALSPFKSFSTRLGLLKGDAVFVIGISGDWENPKVNGGISLADGAIGLKDYPAYRITDLKGYLYLDNDKVVLQDLRGKLGGGDLDLSGVLYLKKFVFSRFYVEAKMHNITSVISPEFSVNFGGSLLYKGTAVSQIVSGNIDINRARYKERVEWKSWLLQKKRTEKVRADIASYEKANLNIRIAGKDDISIDNNVARAMVSSDMVLRGTLYRPVLFGRLETKDGTVYFRNNEFKILHASADFSDPNRLDPVIAIAAETTVKGYRIKMNLEGQLDHFNMALVSDPPLKEMDVLALLTVGQAGGGVKGFEAGIGAGEATSFVTGKMQDVIEERVRSITGLDRFQIDPYVSKTTGTVEPRVTVSKRMLGDKLFVTYTSALGSKEEQVVKLEYFMNSNISLVGVRDERGIAGGDVRFRFEFK
ncbi:MAG: translocation/assembly module TamB domain-containing protein [Nitrospirae bacterium]|nr:translocation/assembly module TamB domain-containing protein [Nitrospirota bacterium]